MNPVFRHPLGGNCSDCGSGIVPASVWRRWTPEERTASGRRMRRNEKCVNCSQVVPERKTWKLASLIEEAEFLLNGGTSQGQVAKQLGLKEISLIRAFYRGRKAGLTTRRLSENNSGRNR